MNKKSKMKTLDDAIREDAEKVAAMTDEEVAKYVAKMKKTIADARAEGIKTIDLEELSESDEEIPYLTLDNLGAYMAMFNKDIDLKHLSQNGKTSKRREKLFICIADALDTSTALDLAEKVLKNHNCDIYYYDIFDNNVNVDYYEQILSRFNLFVCPITKNLFKNRNRVLDIELNVASDYGIPILFVMTDGDRDDFTKHFGKIEFLNANKDNFQSRLDRYLDDVLISDELVKRIEKEFVGRIFLSYRKKDIAHAKKFIELIHSDNIFRDLAIWYDDYLTPGENFDDEIKDSILSSDIFALLVTPNLLEEGNYVLTKEFPFAKDKGKTIVDVMAVPTDIDNNSPLVNNMVNMNDEDKVKENFKKILIDKVVEKNNSPEHLYYIGLAYLYGIQVEKNVNRGINCLVESSEQNYLPALCVLAKIRYSKMKELLPIEKMLKLEEKAIKSLTEELNKGNYQNISSFWDIAQNTITEYMMSNDYEKAGNLLMLMTKNVGNIQGRKYEKLKELVRLYFRFSVNESMQGHSEKALTFAKEGLRNAEILLESRIAEKPYALIFRLNGVAMQCYFNLQKPGEALTIYKKVKEYKKEEEEFFSLDDELAYTQCASVFVNTLLQTNQLNLIKEDAISLIDEMSNLPLDEINAQKISKTAGALAYAFFAEKDITNSAKYYLKGIDALKNSDNATTSDVIGNITLLTFNLANVLFQGDRDQEAIPYFLEVIENGYKFDFDNCFTLLQTAVNYYSQLLYGLGEYEDAIDNYEVFLQSAPEKFGEQDAVLFYCGDFSRRIAFIYKSLGKTEESIKNLLNAIIYINKMEDKENDNVLALVMNIKDELNKIRG